MEAHLFYERDDSLKKGVKNETIFVQFLSGVFIGTYYNEMK